MYLAELQNQVSSKKLIRLVRASVFDTRSPPPPAHDEIGDSIANSILSELALWIAQADFASDKALPKH